MATQNDDAPEGHAIEKSHGKSKDMAISSKAARNAAAGARQKSKARKGANGVLLKKFESVMCDMFSTSISSNEACGEALHRLTPRYSELPPFVNDRERQELIRNAEVYWESRGLARGCCSRDEAMANGQPSTWPFDSRTSLPQCGCVRGGEKRKRPTKTKTGKDTGGVGDVHNDDRAQRKELQLANMIQCVLALLPDHVRHPDTAKIGNDGNTTFRIVDFAGGTGHLAVPLALLLPHCEVICVDLKKWSLDLLHRRVDGTSDDDGTGNDGRENSHKLPCQSGNVLKTSKVLPNLSTYHGSIQSYPHDFDIGVSLHACGEASDWTMRKCLRQEACWVVCSCCCGKLRREAGNPYVFQSTGANEKEIHYPQSKMFASLGGRNNECDAAAVADNVSNGQHLMKATMFDEIARAADYSELGDVRKPRNACRRAAKALVEWDRLLYAKECMACVDNSGETATRTNHHESNTVLTRMVPWEASPKNDILIGWFQDAYNPYRHCMINTSRQTLATTPKEDASCDVDFQVALHHLFGKNVGKDSGARRNGVISEPAGAENDQNDWTAQEAAEIESQIEQFLENSRTLSEGMVMKFPTGMGSRKRKLIHYTAESMGLRHWSEGKKELEKRVVVWKHHII
mmetsp:Transcript_16332/g.39076  ORF Transcript_16332/g.39076 Transcript_16332/m.39076 type:complete len:630 (+) Transcript_16332:83-1972(+)